MGRQNGCTNRTERAPTKNQSRPKLPVNHLRLCDPSLIARQKATDNLPGLHFAARLRNYCDVCGNLGAVCDITPTKAMATERTERWVFKGKLGSNLIRHIGV